MEGYFARKLESIFPHAQNLKEDWTNRSLKFETNSGASGPQLARMATLLGVTIGDLSVTASGFSTSYGQENVTIVALEFTVSNVRFPAPPET